MDEKGFLMGLASKVKVIYKQGRKNSRYTCDSSRELIIVLEYVSTGEYLLPPLIVTKEGYYYSGNHIKG